MKYQSFTLMSTRHHLTALAFLGFCVSLLPSCGPPGGGSALQSYAPVAPQPPGTARVWFMHTNDPQEQFGDPIIYANGDQIGRSIPGIAFYRDSPPGTYAFSVQVRPNRRSAYPEGRGPARAGDADLSRDLVGRQLARRSCRRRHLLCANAAAGIGPGLSPYVDRQRPTAGIVAS